jgi:hypothetical protein
MPVSAEGNIPPQVSIGTTTEPWKLASGVLLENDESLGALSSPDHSAKLAPYAGEVRQNASRVVVNMAGCSVIDLMPCGVGAEGLTGRFVVIERSPLRVKRNAKLSGDGDEAGLIRIGRVLLDATFSLGPIELTTDVDSDLYPSDFTNSGAPVRLANNCTTIVDKTRTGVVLREDASGVAWYSFDVGAGRDLEIHLSVNSTASPLPSGGPSGSGSDPATSVGVLAKRY